jgi:biopolymer transport protein TolQ
VDTFFIATGWIENSGILQLILQAGLVAKTVLALLLCTSIFSWGVILRKLRTFSRLEKQSAGFIKLFRRSARLSEVYDLSDNFEDAPLASIFQAGYEEVTAQIKAAGYKVGNPSPETTAGAKIKSLEGVRRALQRAASAELTAIEKGLNILATTASASPFVGLFGTVIGIIDAFRGLGQPGVSTSIQAVAPGIAEALITTAAGLFAAIPALIAYNYFVRRLRIMATEMDDFTLEFLNVIERNFT